MFEPKNVADGKAVTVTWGTSPEADAVLVDLDLRPVVLVADPDAVVGDAVRWAFEACDRRIDVRSVTDGLEAIDYLFRQGPYRDASLSPRPSLLVLELELPGVPGAEVLRRIRADARLRTLPVVVLSNSDDDGDVAGAYERGANSYFVKPECAKEFATLVSVLDSYWLRRAQLPPRLF